MPSIVTLCVQQVEKRGRTSYAIKDNSFEFKQQLEDYMSNEALLSVCCENRSTNFHEEIFYVLHKFKL